MTVDYEQKLIDAKHIRFLPYIGTQYAEATPKIFILGHSHYADCDGSPEQMLEWDNDKNRTRDVIQDDYLSTLTDARDEGKNHPHAWVRCYRKMAAVLTGKGYQDSDYIWDHLIFSNFWQKNVGISPHDRQFCTTELLESSRSAFFENLAIFEPDYVIVWGAELYKELPDKDFIGLANCGGATERAYGIEDCVGYYQAFPKTILWWMKHPSAPSFSYDNEHSTWKAVLTIKTSR